MKDVETLVSYAGNMICFAKILIGILLLFCWPFSSQLRTAEMTNLNAISFIVNLFHAVKIQDNLVCYLTC